MAEPSNPQPNTGARCLLFFICCILFIIWVSVAVLWGNLAFIIIFGILFVMSLVCTIGAIRRQQEPATGMNAATPRRAQTPPAPAPAAFRTDCHHVFIIGGQGVPAGSNHGQPVPQTNIWAWRENDPPPPYSELPLHVQQHGVLAAQKSTAAQPTSVVNQNV